MDAESALAKLPNVAIAIATEKRMDQFVEVANRIHFPRLPFVNHEVPILPCAGDWGRGHSWTYTLDIGSITILSL